MSSKRSGKRLRQSHKTGNLRKKKTAKKKKANSTKGIVRGKESKGTDYDQSRSRRRESTPGKKRLYWDRRAKGKNVRLIGGGRKWTRNNSGLKASRKTEKIG